MIILGTNQNLKKGKLTTANFSAMTNKYAIAETTPATQNAELTQAIEAYLLDKTTNGLSKHTMRSYENALEQVVSFVSEESKIKTLAEWSQVDLDKTYINIQNGKNGKTGKPLAEKTKETYLRNFRLFVRWLVVNGYIASNLYVKPFRAPQAPPKMYTKEEIYKLIQPPVALERMSFLEFRNYVITMVLIETGVRRSSLINIKIRDVDLENNQIQIVRSKNKNVYCVRLTEEVTELLRKYLMFRAPYNSDVQNYEVLFCDEYQRPLTANGISTIIAKYLKSRGIECKGIHAFRHSAATMMYENGASVAEVAQQTGHKDLRQVEGYIHTVTAMQQDKIEKYSPLANAPRKKIS